MQSHEATVASAATADVEETPTAQPASVEPSASSSSGPAASGSNTADGDEALKSQVRLDGLNKHCTKKEVMQRLQYSMGVTQIRKIKKQAGHDFAFVYFENAAARYAAEEKIVGHVWKGQELRVVQATPLDPERFGKREREDEARGNGGKKHRQDGADGSKLRAAQDVVTPLHGLDYDEQLKRKRQGLLDALRRLPVEMGAAAKSVPEAQKYAFRKLPWLESGLVKANEGSPVPLTSVIPADLMSGYRNKCEFSFGRDEHGAPCLGFQLGRIAVVGPVVGPPGDCPNVRAIYPAPSIHPAPSMRSLVARSPVVWSPLAPRSRHARASFWRPPAVCMACPVQVSDAMKEVVRRVQAFLLESPLPPYSKLEQVGFWRQLLVRQAFNPAAPSADGAADGAADGTADGIADGAADGATPLLLVFMARTTDADPAILATEKARLVAALTATPHAPPLQLSIAFQPCDGPGEAVATEKLEWLQGSPYIEETLLGLSYRVSAAAFFQVNTPGAEQLCTLLRSLCDCGPDTVLLDVCCGTGTIGLSLASSVKRVIGIELCVPAVHDARDNAKRNGVENATFIASKAEDATRRLLDSLTDAEKSSLVAIVDPPRAGLHAEVCKALRACLPLRRLIFVACHAPSFVTNAVALCRPPSTSFQGAPFVPKQAYALDLFPHTPHCELIVLLERAEDEANDAKVVEEATKADAAKPEPSASTDAVGG